MRDDQKSLKLSGFNHGLHPKIEDVQGFFKNHWINLKQTILVYDQEYCQDFIVAQFNTRGHDRRQQAQDRRQHGQGLAHPSHRFGGVTSFTGRLTKLRG
jgi:hypothetical protein